MDEIENGIERLKKLDRLKEVAVPWREIFETAQKSEKKLSIDEAQQEGCTRRAQAFSLLESMSKSELVNIAFEFLFDLRGKEWMNKSLRAQASITVKQREFIRQRLRDMQIKASERGAKAAGAGIKSGAIRRKQSRVPTPANLKIARQELLDTGKPPREISAMLARKYDCTTDHIRKVLKRD